LRGTGWAILAAVEVLLAGAAVILDVFIPTLVLLALAAVSLAVRRQRPSALGFRRSTRPGRMIAAVFGLTVAWDLFQIGLTKPILNRLTGEHQDLSQFAGLQGNLSSLLVTCSPTGPEDSPSGHMLARQSYEHGSVTSGPRLRQSPVPHASEVVFGRQLQPPNCDHAPTRLEELVGLVDLKGAVRAECIAGDFAVGNRTEDDAVLAKDVVHGKDAGTSIADVRDPAHGLGGE
jgi:hypothetical protein